MTGPPGTLPASPFLYPILDHGLLEGRPADRAVVELAAAGVRLLQLRAKGLPDAELLEWVRPAVTEARRTGVTVIVNDRPDVALIVGAHGVHVGQDDLDPRDCRRLLGPSALVGLSTHSLEQVEAAREQPVDYLAVGPVFATTSKEAPDPVVGLELLRRARAKSDRKIVAIGGIDASNARAVVEAGADGLAVIGALLRAADLRLSAEEIRAAMPPATLR